VALFRRRSGQVPDRLTRTVDKSTSISAGVGVAVDGVAAPEVVRSDEDGGRDACEKLRFSEMDEASERSDSASEMSPYERYLDIPSSLFPRRPHPSAGSPDQEGSSNA
jgi:hypothetical protein